MSNQRPGRIQAPMDRPKCITPQDLVTFLSAAVEALEKRGEVDAAARFEIMRDHVAIDVIENGKSFSFNNGISLGL